MAICGDLRVTSSLPLYRSHTLLPTTSFLPQKVDFHCFINGGSSRSEFTPKHSSVATVRSNMRGYYKPIFAVLGGSNFSSKSVSQETENFLLDAVNMSFFERLNLAWKIVFPSAMSKRSSVARIAKQRLKVILLSDRCEVSDEAKRKIVNNIVQSLSDFLEIESQDKVQLNVSADTDIGTICSVTVPVRRVKPEYQEVDEAGTITNIEYKDTGDISGSVDVRFDFCVPDETSRF
ncbi:unnamed protein product [Lathyrus oleraceus]